MLLPGYKKINTRKRGKKKRWNIARADDGWHIIRIVLVKYPTI